MGRFWRFWTGRPRPLSNRPWHPSTGLCEMRVHTFDRYGNMVHESIVRDHPMMALLWTMGTWKIKELKLDGSCVEYTRVIEDNREEDAS